MCSSTHLINYRSKAPETIKYGQPLFYSSKHGSTISIHLSIKKYLSAQVSQLSFD